MAKAKANKDYKAGGAKKWLIIVAILVLIAIIVTVIVILIPANTSDAVDRLRQSSQTSFLENQREQENYDELETKVETSMVRYYSQELQDIRTLSGSVNQMLDFYYEYLPFAEDNNVFSDNYHAIKDNLENAVNYQQDMNEYISEAINLEDDADLNIQNLWIDFRLSFSNYLGCMSGAIEALNNCYQGCFNSTLSNNIASSTILNTVDDFLSVITDEFEQLTQTDVKGHTTVGGQSYSYESHGKVLYLSAFVENYIINDSDIMQYNFNSDLQSKYRLINRYFETHNQSNFVSVIDSISNDAPYNITLTFSNPDSEGIYDAVKAFIDVR